MKFIFSLLALLSGLIIADFLLSFFGSSPFNEGGGLFYWQWYWNRILMLALIVFALSIFSLLNGGLSFRNSRAKYITLIACGAILTLAALPVGAMILISTSCCGGPSTGYEFVGPLLGIGVFVGGISLLILGIVKLKRTPAR